MVALAIGFAGIVSEKIAVKTIQIIHGVLNSFLISSKK
jgi:hypothetical protein